MLPAHVFSYSRTACRIDCDIPGIACATVYVPGGTIMITLRVFCHPATVALPMNSATGAIASVEPKRGLRIDGK